MIFVTGSSGMVGYNLCKFLEKQYYDVVGTYNNSKTGKLDEIKLDITDKYQVKKTIEKIKPDVVIHCAAMTNVDECESHPAQAMKVNGTATGYLARAAKDNKSKFVYISTSFVFGEGKKLDENSETNPINVYGKSKLEGEKKVTEIGGLIVRIDQPYGWVEQWQKQNTVTKTIENFKAGKPFKVVSDWYNQPTYMDNLFEVIEELINKDRRGTFHCVSPKRISRFEWAKEIGNVFGYDVQLVQPMLSKELNLIAKRPDIFLKVDKLQELDLPTVATKEGLQMMKECKQ